MSREIKVRAWVKSLGYFEYLTLNSHATEFNSGRFKDVVEFQGFTGLADDNGRPIYEGDILRVKSYDSWSDLVGFYYKSIVFYDSSEACYKHCFNPELGGTRFTRDSRTKEFEMEVIGNIFENPELLEPLDKA